VVAVLVGEAVDLVFDARAVARATPSITPVYIGERSRLARMMSWVRLLVWVIQHGSWRGCWLACRGS
jgi:hypothetical protein